MYADEVLKALHAMTANQENPTAQMELVDELVAVYGYVSYLGAERAEKQNKLDCLEDIEAFNAVNNQYNHSLSRLKNLVKTYRGTQNDL